MNDKIKQLWCDIQHYGKILNQFDKSDYNDFYTERTHRYQDTIYKSFMLNGELIVLLRRKVALFEAFQAQDFRTCSCGGCI